MSAPAKRNFGISLPCPKCKKLNPIETRICTCGNRFIDPNENRDSAAIPFLKPEAKLDNPFLADLRLVKRSPKAVAADEKFADAIPKTVEPEPKRRFKRMLIFAPFFFVGIAGFAYWSTWRSINPDRIPDKDNSSIVSNATAGVPAGQNTNDVSGQTIVVDGQKDVANGTTVFGGPSSNPNVPDGENDGLQRSETNLGTKPRAVASVPNQDPQQDLALATANEQAKPLAPSGTGNQGPAAGNINNSSATLANKSSLDPSKPSARCGDGTFSYVRSRGGACAYRGGVVEWLAGSDPSVKKPAESKPPANTGQVSGAKTYQLGPRGGCYYISASGSKTYVDKSLCGQ